MRLLLQLTQCWSLSGGARRRLLDAHRQLAGCSSAHEADRSRVACGGGFASGRPALGVYLSTAATRPMLIALVSDAMPWWCDYESYVADGETEGEALRRTVVSASQELT